MKRPSASFLWRWQPEHNGRCQQRRLPLEISTSPLMAPAPTQTPAQAAAFFVSFPSLPSSSSSSRSHVPPAPLWRSERAWRDRAIAASVVATEDLDVIPMQSPDSTDQQDEVVALAAGREEEKGGGGSSSHSQVGGFAFESGGVGGITAGDGGSGGGGLSSSPSPSPLEDREDVDRLVDRGINAAIVSGRGDAQ